LKLHSTRFEKALRRGVKNAIRESPGLKREFRKANKQKKHVNISWLMRIIWSVMLAGLVWETTRATGHPVTALAIITLWSASVAFSSAHNLVTCLFRAPDIPALAMLPVSESAIFRWELGKYSRVSLFALGDLLACYGIFAFDNHPTIIGYVLALALTGLSWIMTLALAGLLTTRLPRFPYQLVPLMIVGTAVAYLYLRKYIGPSLIVALDHAAPSLNLLLPTGWGPSQFEVLLSHGNWVVVALIVPVILVIWTIPNSLSILRGRYLFHEPTVTQSPDLVPADDAKTVAPDQSGTVPSKHLGVTAIEEVVRSHLFQAEPVWCQSGWFERRLWRWFNSRERALAEFAFPNGLIITRRWRSLWRNFAVVLLVAMLAGVIGPLSKFAVLGVGLFVTICQLLQVGFSRGAGFRPMFNSGARIPLYAGFPVGFRELSRVLVKYTGIQLPLIILFTMAGGMVAGQIAGFGIIAGGVFGFKIGALMFAAQVINIGSCFTSTQHEFTLRKLRTICFLAAYLACGALFLGFTGLGLFLPWWPAALGASLLAMLDAYALFRIYGWGYHANLTDLTPVRAGG